MTIPQYVADAFCDKPFSGNPAAVCILNEWISDSLMQQIAEQNNLAETAFIVKDNDSFHIRWFTPVAEVPLAGHPTLATAHILFSELNYTGDVIIFHSRERGKLTVKRAGDEYILNFPTDTIERTPLPDFLTNAFNIAPVDYYKGLIDYMLIFKSQQEIEEAIPDLAAISKAESRGVIITAPGENVDFVSRYFAPQFGIDEDPVTGSAHTTLIPYWWQRFGRLKMTAAQLSARKGFLSCAYLNERVEIGGKARTFSKGEIYI
jgi:PhzF family phenazine biosynthesis protein